MQTRRTKILGTGKYLPSRQVTAEQLDEQLGKRKGWVFKKSGVRIRHYADGETVSQMGAKAAIAALLDARLSFRDIDCIICTNSIPEQPIPCTAAIIQMEMNQGESGVPCFDVNSTCLSFLAGFDLISYLVDSGRYRRVLIVAPEIASVGLNYKDPESSILFGDGAAAVIIGKSTDDEHSRILASRIETYGSGHSLSEVRGGGSKLPSTQYGRSNADEYLFQMQGEALFRKTSKLLPEFLNRLFADAGAQMSGMKLVIPHQGSAMAMRLLQKKLEISDSQFMNIIENHGNTIAASLPMGLHEAIHQGRLKRGDYLALVGISAGVSLGGMVLEY
ncbi:3-oxoacyl-[acyl-carrier-protein] synthase-3 [Paenibacillus castaneae]|uniref:beta-ketoacyl-ACP synthase III n=1 Tax=Paenibacillus castaneae TaxID=474957 RepID=UPI000C9B9985|nr:beta-ketoacyl-ACP synthase III [Paenibacillus castaneae]NIK75181.1 3-oxoacyl-[acyl-carrier-protein] synthase-3 [Paenibacillus castaneae]